MNLSDMRARVRRDLHDEDDANYRWTNDELDRHIGRAVRELSLAAPLQAKATLTTTAGSRDLSISGVADLVAVETAEYPVGKYPPAYIRFSLWANVLTMLVDAAPAGGESVYLYYGKLHTLSASASTIPAAQEDLVAVGAEAYAALEWSSYATNRVNPGGSEAPHDYLVWGQDRLAEFAKGLAKVSRKNAVRQSRLYRPYEAGSSQATDWGP